MSGQLLGIDAGTSSVKVCAFNQDGTLAARASRPVHISSPAPGQAELDLDRYWAATTGALSEVLAQCGDVAGVGFATTAPTTVLMDGQGQALRPGIPFLDNRSAVDLAEVEEALGGAEAFYARVGNRLSPSTCSAATVRHLMREEPEVWARTTQIGFLNSYLAARLTGRVAVEPTQASYSGLFSLAGPTGWDAGLVEALRIPPGVLPPFVQPFDRLGDVTSEAAAETGLPAGTPVALGSGDTAAAAFAVGVREGSQSFESAGTSGVLTFCLDQPIFDGAFMNRCHVVSGRWLAHGAMSTPGGARVWLREQLWPEYESTIDLEELAKQSEPGARGILFLPYLAGERSPIWDPAASGVWFGMRLDTTRADMVRAVFEGAAYGLRQIMERGEQRWGWRPERLLAVGGGTRSHLLQQIKSDVLNVAYQAAELPDAAALGAALMGGIAAGVYSGVNDPALPRAKAVGEPVVPGPAEQRQRYDHNYRVYTMLYPALREAMHALRP